MLPEAINAVVARRTSLNFDIAGMRKNLRFAGSTRGLVKTFRHGPSYVGLFRHAADYVEGSEGR
jgi:hypothetical protein